MDIFSLNSPAGSAPGSAAFLMLRELINYLESTDKLSSAEITSLAAEAITKVPRVDDPLKNDTRTLLESLKR